MDICLAGNVVTQEESRACAQPLQLNTDAGESNTLLKADGSVSIYSPLLF